MIIEMTIPFLVEFNCFNVLIFKFLKYHKINQKCCIINNLYILFIYNTNIYLNKIFE